jgi:hypothetical protein
MPAVETDGLDDARFPPLEKLQSLYTEGSGDHDIAFIDALTAALRFKAYLIGSGVDVPQHVIVGLAELATVFDIDLLQYERTADIEKSPP